MGSSTHCRCVIAQAATHIYLRNLLRATPDVSAIGDAAIRASKEFQSYMDRNNRWQWQDRVTEAEALHACRLMLRDVSVRQARRANAIADRYRDSIDWGQREVRVVVNGKVRVLDIADPAGYRAVEVKSGYVSHSRRVARQLLLDAELITHKKWTITWYVKGHFSDPLKLSLRKAGIKIIETNPRTR